MKLLLAWLFIVAGMVAAQAACPTPNPNFNAPPFVDGCPLPAEGLNRLAQMTGFQVSAYGAKCNNSTDDTAAIQAAINAAAAAGSGTVVIPPTAVCKISTALVISTSQTGIVCSGYSKGMVDNYTAEIGLPKCTLQWVGAPGGTILKISAPLGTTSNLALYGNFVRGINFDGNNGLAANGLVIETVMQGMFEGNRFGRFNGGVALDLNVVHATTTNFNQNFCSQNNMFLNNTIDQHFTTSIGLRLGAWIDPTAPGGGCNASVNTFINTSVSSSTATAILLDGADNNRFINTAAITDAGGGPPSLDISIRKQGSSVYPSNSNLFYGLSTPASGGKIVARGRESFPACDAFYGLPLTTAPGNLCTYANSIDGLDFGNGAGGNFPLAETGSQFSYRWGSENYLHTAALPDVVGCSGLGAGAVCATESESKNEAGFVNIQAGTVPSANGIVELKLNGYMGKKLVCTTQLMPSTASWANTASTQVESFPIATAPAYAYYTLKINWYNATVPLTAASWYRIGYTCRGFGYF